MTLVPITIYPCRHWPSVFHFSAYCFLRIPVFWSEQIQLQYHLTSILPPLWPHSLPYHRPGCWTHWKDWQNKIRIPEWFHSRRQTGSVPALHLAAPSLSPQRQYIRRQYRYKNPRSWSPLPQHVHPPPDGCRWQAKIQMPPIKSNQRQASRRHWPDEEFFLQYFCFLSSCVFLLRLWYHFDIIIISLCSENCQEQKWHCQSNAILTRSPASLSPH